VLRSFAGGRRFTPRLAGIVAGGVAYWGLTAISRSTIDSPSTSRYLYLGAVLVVLLATELLADCAPSRRVLTVAAGLALLATLSSMTALSSFADALRASDARVSAELGALQLAAAYAPAGYRPDPSQASPVTAAAYLHVVHEIGSSPADTPARILAAPAGARLAADAVLARLELHLEPAVGLVASSCRSVTPAPGALTSVPLEPRGNTLTLVNPGGRPATLSVRRFAVAFTPLPGGVPAHGARTLTIARDADGLPWQVSVSLPSAISVCGTR
jgi:hypothetical protein